MARATCHICGNTIDYSDLDKRFTPYYKSGEQKTNKNKALPMAHQLKGITNDLIYAIEDKSVTRACSAIHSLINTVNILNESGLLQNLGKTSVSKDYFGF